MTFPEALAYLQTASERGSKLGLSRVQELMHLLGSPQKQMQIIHIAGTNGKGSVGAMLASILTAAGCRTGHFSSPALTGVQDYFRINREVVTQTQFAAAISEVEHYAGQMADPPTEFEILAAAAYVLFVQEACDIAVIECCMGGDTDCTNVVDEPILSIITNVQLDHCGFLGNTTAEIAAHKAGIIKPGRPVVFGDSDTDESACAVIRERAAACAAPLRLVSERMGEMHRTDLDGTVYCFGGREYQLSLLGPYQAVNAAAVLHAVDVLRGQGVTIPEAAVSEGLSHVTWHGRFEVLHREPLVLFDGAHNPHGIAQLRNSLGLYLGSRACAALVGVMADKEYSGYPALFSDRFSRVFTVTPDNPRALDARELAGVFRKGGIPSEAFSTVGEGVAQALSYARQQQIPLLAFGSLYLYREFCEKLREIL